MKPKQTENLSKLAELDPPVSMAGSISDEDIDIWAKDRLTEELLVERLQDKESIIDGISDALMLLDAKNYRILDVNQAFLKSYRLSYEDVLGKKCHEITHHIDKSCSQVFGEGSCPLEETASTGKLCHVEHIHKDRDGKTLYFEITAYPVKDASGQVTRIIHLSRDVTDRKHSEEEMKRSSEKIKFFAYSVAHDLKSPAIGIHGLTQRLHDHYAQNLDEKGKNYCSQILKASEQLMTLTENINAFISEKETSPIFENFRLKEIFGAAKEEFSAQLYSRNIRWSEPVHDPEIRADKLSLIRMLRNLVDNALKHGGNGLSEIRIGHEVSDKVHIISVTDDGVGVGHEGFEKIFDPFERRHVSKGIVGTGLGLAIVKEIANQHKGRVWSEPARRKGTTFFVTISTELATVESGQKKKPDSHDA
jgi:PAS domain S-box-containing protein